MAKTWIISYNKATTTSSHWSSLSTHLTFHMINHVGKVNATCLINGSFPLEFITFGM